MSPRAATPIVVVTSGFPRISETFALNELLALERAGAIEAIFATKPGDDRPRQPGADSLLRHAVGGDFKNIASVLLYIMGMVVACWSARLAQGLYVLVALMWLIPDRRIERQLRSRPS